MFSSKYLEIKKKIEQFKVQVPKCGIRKIDKVEFKKSSRVHLEGGNNLEMDCSSGWSWYQTNATQPVSPTIEQDRTEVFRQPNRSTSFNQSLISDQKKKTNKMTRQRARSIQQRYVRCIVEIVANWWKILIPRTSDFVIVRCN